MNPTTLFMWGLAGIGGLALIYGLHRLMIRLEKQGLIYYRNEKPRRGGGTGALGVIQEVIEPRSHHVFIMQDEPLLPRHDEAGSAPRAPGRIDLRPAKDRRELGS